MNDRPADRSPKLVQAEGRFHGWRSVEIIARVQFLVAEIFEQAAMKLVGSGLGDEIDNRAHRLAVFGREHRFLNADLTDGVQTGARNPRRRGVGAIRQIRIDLARIASVDKQARAGFEQSPEAGAVHAPLTAVARHHYAWNQTEERGNAAAVGWQLGD